MRILHTSDWHIGKRIIERDRLPEQEAALLFLARVCEEKQVDLVLVAGDIFDTYLPSAEAEELFFRAVKRLAGEDRAVVIVSGNHDDALRLSASSPLASGDGIYLFGTRSPVRTGGEKRRVRALEIGEHHAVIGNEKGERVYINALPYPSEARYREEKTEESFPERIARWIARGDEAFGHDMPHILLTHLFVAGGKVSESERSIDLGGARAVPLSVMPSFGYNALGHLHKRQTLGGNNVYCGSLLQYSFDENADKSVYLLETEGDTVRIAGQIPVEGGRRLVRLEGGLQGAKELLSRYPGTFIELTLHLKEPLSSAETAALKEANEGLVSIIAKVEGETAAPAVSRASLSDEELFTEYYRFRYGEDPSSGLKEAFLKLLEET